MGDQVATFDELRPTDADRAGGKGANLGELGTIHDPNFVEHLVRAGITSVSVSPDAVDRTRRAVAVAERRVLPDQALSVPTGG
ncbi:hypothetical protein [Nocardia tengchongensis]|uniref:hypothetical protein n=1 Tax=Nocardia tengchongensis TaxID=2055889 RepID=UPI0036B176BF